MNIYQKIAAVMEDVKYLTKDDSVDAGYGKSYRAITEEKVTSTVRASMLKHGLAVYPSSMQTNVISEVVQTKNGDRTNRVTHIDVVYRMANVDDPNEFIDIASSGTGVDTQDKGIGKAMTYAYKYMLLRTFAIPTGDDPDKIASDVYTDKLYGDAAKGARATSSENAKSDQNDTPEARELVKNILYGLGGGDVARVVTYAEALYEKQGIAFEDMTLEQLNNVKVRLVNKLKADKQEIPA